MTMVYPGTVCHRRKPVVPTSIRRSRWGCCRWNFGDIFGIEKLRVPGLTYGVVNVILGSATFVQLRLLTDDGQTNRRTDTQTHDDS